MCAPGSRRQIQIAAALLLSGCVEQMAAGHERYHNRAACDGGACVTTYAAHGPANHTSSSSWTCTGRAGNTWNSAGSYYTTSFGCWVDSQGRRHGDSDDNCIPYCPLSSIGCSGLSGPECEYRLNWFIAGSDRFGCGTKLRLRAPHNGKEIVVISIDKGPSCSIERRVGHWVIDMSTAASHYLFGGETAAHERREVIVELAPSSAPLGPVGASTTTGDSTTAGNATASCEAQQANTESRISTPSCRHLEGTNCGAGRRCVNTYSVDETDCISSRCRGGSNIMCCRTASSPPQEPPPMQPEPLPNPAPEASMCEVQRQNTESSISTFSCRYAEGNLCGSARSCVNVNNVNETNCITGRCMGGNEVRCCETGTSSSSTDPCAAARSNPESSLTSSCRYPVDASCGAARTCVNVNSVGEHNCISRRCQGGAEIRCCES